MLAALALFFAVVWVLALITMKTASAAIHLLLVVAVISFIAHMVRTVTPGSLDGSGPII